MEQFLGLTYGIFLSYSEDKTMLLSGIFSFVFPTNNGDVCFCSNESHVLRYVRSGNSDEE